MSRHDDEVSLRQMLDHAREAVFFARDKSRQSLDKDRKLNLALVRLLEVVGEAARRVSETKRQQCAEVEWPMVIAMRNRLIHGYDEVDLDILWATIQIDLPELIKKLESVLG